VNRRKFSFWVCAVFPSLVLLASCGGGSPSAQGDHGDGHHWRSWRGSDPKLSAIEIYTGRGLLSKQTLSPSPAQFGADWYQLVNSRSPSGLSLARISSSGEVVLTPVIGNLAVGCDPSLFPLPSLLVGTCDSSRGTVFSLSLTGHVNWVRHLRGPPSMYDEATAVSGSVSIERWMVSAGIQLRILRTSVSLHGNITQTSESTTRLPAAINDPGGQDGDFVGATAQMEDGSTIFTAISARGDCLVVMRIARSGQLQWAKENLNTCIQGVWVDSPRVVGSHVFVGVNNESNSAIASYALNGTALWTRVILDPAPLSEGTVNLFVSLGSERVAYIGTGDGTLFNEPVSRRERTYGMYVMTLRSGTGQEVSISRINTSSVFNNSVTLFSPCNAGTIGHRLSIYEYVWSQNWPKRYLHVPYAVVAS
jgi:hypothetical protein